VGASGITKCQQFIGGTFPLRLQLVNCYRHSNPFFTFSKQLAEHQLKTGAANPPEFLQSYFFRALKEQGGVDFLPHLLDLWKCYCPDLDLNFGVDTTGRTPWWYLVNSNDVSVMSRVLQALKNIPSTLQAY